MKPDQLRRAYHSLEMVDEIATFAPDLSRPLYLTLSNADPQGSVRDPRRLFLRLTKAELNIVVASLLDFHERRLTELGIDWEGEEEEVDEE